MCEVMEEEKKYDEKLQETREEKEEHRRKWQWRSQEESR